MMEDKKKYIVVRGPDLVMVESVVNRYMRSGYVPIGGIETEEVEAERTPQDDLDEHYGCTRIPVAHVRFYQAIYLPEEK